MVVVVVELPNWYADDEDDGYERYVLYRIANEPTLGVLDPRGLFLRLLRLSNPWSILILFVPLICRQTNNNEPTSQVHRGFQCHSATQPSSQRTVRHPVTPPLPPPPAVTNKRSQTPSGLKTCCE